MKRVMKCRTKRRFASKWKLWACSFIMFTSLLLGGVLPGTMAAEPKVMVTDYEVNPEMVNAGDTFSLTVTLHNTATKKVKNLKISLLSEDGSILPDTGAGTAYVQEIAADTKQNFDFDMRAVEGLQEKSYKLTVKLEYEDGNGMPYTVEDAIYIPIVLENRISITELFSTDDVKIGEEAEIFAVINNLGDGTIHNVTAYIQGKSVETQSVYIGNIEPGKSSSVDILAEAKTVTTSGPDAVNTLTVIYEDSRGNTYEESKEVSVFVQSSTYENLEVLKEDKGTSGINKTIVILVVVACLMVGLLVVKIVKLKKKKKLLEDF